MHARDRIKLLELVSEVLPVGLQIAFESLGESKSSLYIHTNMMLTYLLWQVTLSAAYPQIAIHIQSNIVEGNTELECELD